VKRRGSYISGGDLLESTMRFENEEEESGEARVEAIQ